MSTLDINGMLSQAVSLHQAGQLLQAESLYKKIAVHDPCNADVLHLLGVIAHQRDQNIAAIEFIQKAITIKPLMPHYHNNLGSAYVAMDRTDEAIRCFEEALRLKDDYIEALNNLGNAFQKKGDNLQARRHYCKAIEIAPDYLPARNNFANILKEEGRLDEAIALHEESVAISPANSAAHYNLGNAYREAGQHERAINEYSQAIHISPEFAEAHSNLANVFKKTKQYDKAITHYKKALHVNPDFAEAYSNLGDTFRILGRFHDALDSCEKALAIKPDFKEAYVTLGTTRHDCGEFSASIDHYKKALEIRPDYADAHYNLGLVLLMQGEYREGWKEYSWRFKCKEIAEQINYRRISIPEWEGSSLNNKTILVISEQGIGDQIQFVRYVTHLRKMGARVVLESAKELMRLFESFNGIDRIVERSDSCDYGEKLDFCVHLLNLPALLGTDSDNIDSGGPYLFADHEEVHRWNLRLKSSSFNVGIVWAGNPNHSNDLNRSCEKEHFEILNTIPGVALFSLQKQAMKSNDNCLSPGKVMTDLGGELRDFSDTAAIIQALDLVITVDTAVAHLAGALGKSVWTLLPYVPDWRWMLSRDDSPWYPAMRLFRQEERGDWHTVFSQIDCSLRKYINSISQTTCNKGNKQRG